MWRKTWRKTWLQSRLPRMRGDTFFCGKCKRCKKAAAKAKWESESELEPEPEPPESAPSKETIQDANKAEYCSETTKPAHPLFLHIQLYVFANVYQIDPLKNASQKKIIGYLKKVENSSSKSSYTDAIFDLFDCAFLYLPDSDPLLDWLARYAGWNLIALRQESERLENLLRTANGKFAGLLVKHVESSHKSPFVSLS